MIVLLGHADAFFPTPRQPWLHLGSYLNQTSAVYGFLIISGYSIAASLDRSQRGFFAQRFWRIYPIYIASLILTLFVGFFVKSPITVGDMVFTKPTPIEMVVASTMLQSFVWRTVAIDGQMWTLAVEWWNYVLAPLYRRLSSTILMLPVAASLMANIVWPAPPAATSYGGHMFAILS